MKYLLHGIGIFFALIFAVMVLMVGVVAAVNKPKGDKEQVLPGKGDRPKKAIIIYQPALTKITARIAQELAAGLNAGGYEVILNHPGAHLSTNLSGYELVVFGSPTYAGQLTKALTNYMQQVCPQLAAATDQTPRIVLFATGGLDQTEEFDRLAGLLTGLNVVKKVKFTSKGQNAYDLGLELAQE
jgi:flavorubredoxin